MDCRTTSRVKRGLTGSSFVELMVSLSLSSLVALALASLAFYSAKRFMATTAEAELSSMSRNAVDSFTAQARQMWSVGAFTTNSIVLLDQAGASNTFTWSPGTRIFRQITPTGTKILLSDCDSLSFALCNANPIDGVLDVEATAKVKDCKAIKVQWTCSRTNWHAATKTQVKSAQTIVLRSKSI